MKREISWWRLLLGSLLVYINVKFLLFPQTRTLQPANAGEATGMGKVRLPFVMALGFFVTMHVLLTPVANSQAFAEQENWDPLPGIIPLAGEQ